MRDRDSAYLPEGETVYSLAGDVRDILKTSGYVTGSTPLRYLSRTTYSSESLGPSLDLLVKALKRVQTFLDRKGDCDTSRKIIPYLKKAIDGKCQKDMEYR